MRYYAIQIAGAPSAFVPTPDGYTWTSHPNGVFDPGAQQIEFQIEEYNASTPTENSTLTVHGVSFQQIKQQSDLNGLPISVWGGMMPGLPIATAQSVHRGLLVQGKINRAWGNWVGTEMSIGMQITPAGLISAPGGSIGGKNAEFLHRTGERAAPIRYARTGPRSLDRMTIPRGYATVSRRGPYITPKNGISLAATAPISPAGTLGTIAGPTTGGTPFPTGVGSSFGAATSQLGGVVTSLFGGGGGPGGLSGLQAPINLIHNMQPNEWLGAAIDQTLSTALPMGISNIVISPALKLPYQDAGVYQNLQQYAGYIRNLSMNLLGFPETTGYPGVNMTAYSNEMRIWDATSPIGSGTVSILDLIGQPTWIAPFKCHVKTVLRADLHCGDSITLPPTLMNVSQGAIIPGGSGGTPEQRTNDSFAGSFIITNVLYIGDFRNPDGVGWSANYEALVYGGGAGVTAGGSPL